MKTGIRLVFAAVCTVAAAAPGQGLVIKRKQAEAAEAAEARIEAELEAKVALQKAMVELETARAGTEAAKAKAKAEIKAKAARMKADTAVLEFTEKIEAITRLLEAKGKAGAADRALANEHLRKLIERLQKQTGDHGVFVVRGHEGGEETGVFELEDGLPVKRLLGSLAKAAKGGKAGHDVKVRVPGGTAAATIDECEGACAESSEGECEAECAEVCEAKCTEACEAECAETCEGAEPAKCPSGACEVAPGRPLAMMLEGNVEVVLEDGKPAARARRIHFGEAPKAAQKVEVHRLRSAEPARAPAGRGVGRDPRVMVLREGFAPMPAAPSAPAAPRARAGRRAAGGAGRGVDAGSNAELRMMIHELRAEMREMREMMEEIRHHVRECCGEEEDCCEEGECDEGSDCCETEKKTAVAPVQGLQQLAELPVVGRVFATRAATTVAPARK